jgi:hypothetical protein
MIELINIILVVVPVDGLGAIYAGRFFIYGTNERCLRGSPHDGAIAKKIRRKTSPLPAVACV